MPKTIIYLVLLALLGFGVYYFLFSEKDSFNKKEAGFTTTDTTSIQKIFLADKEGRAVTLERKDNTWYVNNTYPAIPTTVQILLQTLAKQTASYPVPEKMHNNIVQMLAASAVKVELYEKNGDKIKTFYVGGQASNNAGSYMLMEGAQRPYVVQVPGFPGYLTPRYSTDIADWRDRTVFKIPQAQLASASIQYPNEPLNSFIIKQGADGKFTVAVDPVLAHGKQFNERRAIVYSKFFEEVYSEGYINGTVGLDSIIRSVPKRCIIEATAKNGQKQHVEIYWMPINQRSKNQSVSFEGVPNEYDADRFYATINNFKDTVIIQRASFDKFFRRAFEFYQPDDTTSQQQNHSGSKEHIHIKVP